MMHGVMVADVTQSLCCLQYQREAEGAEEDAADQHHENIYPGPTECVPQPRLTGTTLKREIMRIGLELIKLRVLKYVCM